MLERMRAAGPSAIIETLGGLGAILLADPHEA
jgi:hypothetical protein